MDEKRMEKATLGGGCFWCAEAVFLSIEGVINVEPGYSGGSPTASLSSTPRSSR